MTRRALGHDPLSARAQLRREIDEARAVSLAELAAQGCDGRWSGAVIVELDAEPAKLAEQMRRAVRVLEGR